MKIFHFTVFSRRWRMLIHTVIRVSYETITATDVSVLSTVGYNSHFLYPLGGGGVPRVITSAARLFTVGTLSPRPRVARRRCNTMCVYYDSIGVY